jgi:hypothetical protein
LTTYRLCIVLIDGSITKVLAIHSNMKAALEVALDHAERLSYRRFGYDSERPTAVRVLDASGNVEIEITLNQAGSLDPGEAPQSPANDLL